MVSCLLASHGFVYLEAPFIVQLLPAMLAAPRGAVFNGIPPYDLWEHPPALGKIPPHDRRRGSLPGRRSVRRAHGHPGEGRGWALDGHSITGAGGSGTAGVRRRDFGLHSWSRTPACRASGTSVDPPGSTATGSRGCTCMTTSARASSWGITPSGLPMWSRPTASPVS